MAVVYCDQLYEHLHWGPSDGTPETDPNPRLAAYLDAARRGATVRILLNSYAFGDYESNTNAETENYLRSTARQEGLDLEVRLGNPTALGVHNKMVLAHVHGHGVVHVGSINGSEVSSMVNRELALQVQSDAASMIFCSWSSVVCACLATFSSGILPSRFFVNVEVAIQPRYRRRR